jgi:pSer/pThr/pTyr-binding forkhead associated (FHA) protein
VSFVLQRVTGRDLVLNQVSGDVLRIGRGTSAELRSENPAVALDHAAIERDAAGYTIIDKGSITGTYVNKKPVESARLAKGDVIEIGDLHVEVQLAAPDRPLFLRVTSTATPDKKVSTESFAADGEDDDAEQARVGGSVRAPKIDYASAFRLRRPWFTKVSLIAFLVIVTLVVLAEVTLPGNQTAFMPGQISSAHAWERDASGRSVARDCRACHDPWRGVVDQRCLECHVQKPHSAIQAETPSCSSCHPEHRAATTLVGATCVSCHGNLRDHVKPGVLLRPAIAHINAFGDTHPEFTWPPDTDTLAFNHKLHLRPAGILDGEGKREVLQCTGCHKLVETRGKLDPRPLKFATDCARCHKLTFDLRFPDAEVPHGGDPGLLYGFVLAIDSGNQDIAGKSPDEIRRILTNQPPPNLGERAWLNAEQVINKKCTLCHDLQRKAGRLVVTPPVIRTRWLEHGQFTHTPHSGLECVSCHRSAPSSALTRDVLMPSRKECISCHSGSGNKKAACTTCHEYHERTGKLLTKPAAGLTRGTAARAPVATGGMLGTILLLLAIVVLLMVVLIPVSLALYQRLRVPTDESGGARRPSPPPSPVIPPPQKTSPPAAPTVQPKVSTEPPAAAPPAQPAAPAPREPVASMADATVVNQLYEPAPAPTEQLMWYGLLLCTAGPLEGQRFFIEEDGFYIGRDPILSQVVINDSRVSKRHVRIVPRDGRVHAIDQSSTNGTFLRTAKSERITDVQLKRGETIILADNVATFVYQI